MELRVLRYFLTVAKEQRPYSKAINLFIEEINAYKAYTMI